MAEPIKFRTTTATALLKLARSERLGRLSELCFANAQALLASVRFCAARDIGAFRISSQILPVKTHSDAGYAVTDLPDAARIIRAFRDCGVFARAHGLRLSFHPDQFVVLNSPNPVTLSRSLAELDYQAEVAEWVGADTINLHGGGAYGNKTDALRALSQNIERLPAPVRSRLTLENDDKVFTPRDLLPVCEATNTPLVYDVHHHRCLGDGLSVEEATASATATWRGGEPLFHLSSPLEGWDGPKPQRHHDYIPGGFPRCLETSNPDCGGRSQGKGTRRPETARGSAGGRLIKCSFHDTQQTLKGPPGPRLGGLAGACLRRELFLLFWFR
jgi:UV DNA damage endonuclease